MKNKSPRILFQVKAPIRQIAETLKNKQGWEIYGYYGGPISDHAVNECSGTLNLYEIIERSKLSQVPENIIAKCRELEDEYDINLADVIAADRHLGIRWVTGGLYHPGKLSRMPYEKHLQIILDVFTAFRKYLDQINPTIVCSDQVASFVGAISFEICRKMGIPIYGVMPLGIYENYFYWQRDRAAIVPGLEENYLSQRLSQADCDSTRAEIVLDGRVRGVTQLTLQKGNLFDLLKKVVRITKKHLIVTLARGDRAPGGINLSNRLTYLLRNFLGFRKEMRRKYEPVEKLLNSSYIYYPLHYEPEASLNGLEPHFSNQMYAIELLSRSVPVGINVLVKEHPSGIGNRPSYWIDIIEKFPRVKLVHPLENSIDLIKHSIATATITGTSGFEAALLGKPVISLGPNYRYNFINYVTYANDINSLRKLIKDICNDEHLLDLKKNAAHLRKAVEMTCFRLDDRLDDRISFARNPSQESVEIAADELLKLVV